MLMKIMMKFLNSGFLEFVYQVKYTYIEDRRTLSSVYSWKSYLIFPYNISGISLLGFIGNILSAVILSR